MIMNNKQFNAIVLFVKDNIFSGLPSTLYYHGIEHTLLDVLPRCEELAALEGISSDDTYLLKTAALFHDTGFTKSYLKNESIGADIAETTLRSFGFSNQGILTVRQIIMATVVSETPGEHMQSAGSSILEQIICDADLDNLGRNDFLAKGESLRKELAFQGTVMTDREWYIHQMDLLKSHHYYTETAKNTRNKGKEKNMLRLKEIMG